MTAMRSDRASNPYGLPAYEWHLWMKAGQPTGAEFTQWSSLVGALKDKARIDKSREDARIAKAGRAEEQATQEAWLEWQADRLDADGLMATAAAVEADRRREQEAWEAQQARLQQLADWGMP